MFDLLLSNRTLRRVRALRTRATARLGVLLILGALSTFGCDKLALPEHLKRPDDLVAPGDGNHGKSDAGPSGFKPPTQDGGSEDGGVTPDSALCGTGPRTDVPFSKQALLESFAQCAIVQYCEFDSLTANLVTKADAYAATPNETTLLEAKTAWYRAVQEWQVAELFRFGPAAPVMELGGQGLRDNLYAFPNMSRCAIEEQIAQEGYLNGVAKFAPSARGLLAIEYLWFFEGSNNTCSKYSPLNSPAPGTWGALTGDVLAQRKRAYAAALASDISMQAKSLLASWDPQQGNFETTFLTAGKGSKVFGSEQVALNTVSDALYYLDLEVKDWKVARPAGLGECTTNCASTAESLYAKIGSDNVRANLKAFRLLFQGCGKDYAGLGFDDWLHAVGADAVTERMLAALDNADKVMADLDLDRAFVEDPSLAAPARLAIKAITDLIKTDLMTVLNLDRPMALEGDND